MGLFFTCLSIILTFYSVEELVPSLAPFHPQLLMMGFGIAASLPTFAMRPIRSLQAPQYLLMLALWGAVIFSNLSHFKIGWSYDSFRIFAPMVIIFFLVHLNAYSVYRIKLVFATLIICAVGISIQAIMAYHTGYLADQFLLYQADDFRAALGNRVRGLGVLSDPNDFAQFLLVCFACLGFFWRPRHATTNFLVLTPVAAVLLYTMYLTFSRGGLVGLGAIIFFVLYKRGKAIALGATGTVLAFLYLLGFTGNREMALDSSTVGRLIAWGSGIAGVIHNPLFGVGYGRFTKDLNDNALTAHNSFVLCFAELGLVGYFFWMALIFVSVSALWSLTTAIGSDKPEDVDYTACVRTLLAAIFVFLTTGWFLSRTYSELLYILLGAAASLVQLHIREVPVEKRHLGRWAPRVVTLEFVSIVAVYAFIRVRSL